MRLLSVLGASQALTDHLCRHPEQWRELADPFLGSTRPAAYAVRAALLKAVGADPANDAPAASLDVGEAVDALRVEYRRLLTRLAARDLAHHLGVDDASAELSDLAAGTLEAALAIARAQVPGRRPRPARGDRPRQVRRPRAELRLRRRRALRLRAGRRGGRGDGRPGRHAARVHPDAGVLRAHPRGHDLAGRRQPPPGGQGRSARPHPRQPPRLLRALGQDLGVPGPAQGPAGRRRPGARARVPLAGRADGLAGRRARRLRRRCPGDAPTGAGHHPGSRRGPPAQARRGRAARRRVRGPAPAAGARTHRRAPPRPRHPAGARHAHRPWVRRARGRRGAACGVRVPAHTRAPHPAPAPAPHARRTE